MSAHFLRRMRRYALGEFSTSLTALNVHPTVADWVIRVVANGGATPSTTTQSALSVFCSGLDGNSLTALMKSVNCFVPDSLIAALTPLIKTYGNDPWTNGGGAFLSADLTVNGLVGSATGHKYLDSGVIPSTAFATDGSLGYTLYCSSGVSESTTDMGIWAAGGGVNDALYLCYSSSLYFDCHNSSGGRCSHGNSSPLGYSSANRTSTSAAAVYTGTNATGHLTLLSLTGQVSTGTRATCPVFVFAVNSSASPGSALTYCNKRFSFAAIHEGLSQAQSAALYPLVQTVRTSLGGGTA